MKTRIIKRKGTLLSSVAMLSTAMLLTACGGDGGDSPVDDGGANPGESGAQALLYAYPDNGQGEVSTAAPVVLRFSSAVNLGEAQNSITVYEGDAQSGTVVAVTPESVAGEPNNVLLQPDEDLKPNQAYTVVIEDLRLRRGTAKDQTLTFTTRPLHEGPKSLVVKEDTFEVSRRMPDGSDMEPVMDFSSFRFQFTQPIDRATAMYGDGNTVVLRDGAGDPVDATLLIDGAYMTVDPDQEYLNAGETYTLDITAGLASTYGETLGAQSYTLTPKDSSPKGEPAILVQKLTQGNTSRLTGKPINQVPVNGTLLGENKNITQASAEVVRAELADVTTYTDVTPIRLPKGTVLNGAEISPILIGGEVPAGFGSGDVTMTVLSDASGYLVPNPYAGDNPNALRIVHLLMDVGIATSEPRANGAFTQDLLHIELVGLAEVDPTAGVLNLDAVSMVEPNILGQEFGYGMLSFQLQSYKNQNNPPQTLGDVTPPVLQSWTLGDENAGSVKKPGSEFYTPGDAITFNFSEPLEPSSLKDRVKLFKAGEEVESQYYLDGASLVVKKKTVKSASDFGLKKVQSSVADYLSQAQPKTYRIQIGAGITDLSGNALNNEIDEDISRPLIVENKTVITPGGIDFPELNAVVSHAPVILSAYPGFPCTLNEDERDLNAGKAGHCAGGFPGYDQGTEYDIKEKDDAIPVTSLPRNRPIIIQFSKNIEPESLVIGSTFFVDKVDSNGVQKAAVEGTLNVSPRRITFFPDTEWEQGEFYRYTLLSNGFAIDNSDDEAPKLIADDNFECGVNTVCGTERLPLQTQTLGLTRILQASQTGASVRETLVVRTGPDYQAGGPDFVQYFKGAENSNSVLQSLRTLPESDTNANFFSERDTSEKYPTESGTPLIITGGRYQFEQQEYGPSDEPDVYTQGLVDYRGDPVDPNGVRPAPNSAKVLSFGATEMQSGGLNGGNFGCGYQEPFTIEEPIASVCPEHKFTYLTGALTAEVTDEVSGDGVKVLIWPSVIYGTSMDAALPFGLFPGVSFVQAGATGPQVLRMRYAERVLSNGNVVRDQPITAWIKPGPAPNDKPVLTAEVDLYIDLPHAQAYTSGFSRNSLDYFSYKVHMSLTGEVDFLDDGRMVVDQYNAEMVDLKTGFFGSDGGRLGYVDAFIPERGNYLKFVSQPIK